MPNYKDIRHFFNAYIACPKRLWLKVHSPEQGDTEFSPFSHSQDALIELAGLFKGTMANAEGSPEKTQTFIQNKQSATQLVFLLDGYYLRVDLMTYEEDGWHLFLVKPFPRLRFSMVREAALQVQCLKDLLHISQVSVLTINPNYVRKEDFSPRAAFHEHNITHDPLFQKRDLASEFEKIKSLSAIKAEPAIPLSFSCVRPFDCQFKRYCWSNLPKPSIFDVTGIPIKKKFAYYAQGVVSYEEIMEAKIPFTPRQEAQLNTHFSNSILLDHAKLSDYLDSLSYPITYLDFEALQSVIPPYAGTSPYQQIPFQFSAHIQSEPGTEPLHVEFIATLQEDPRYGFAKALAELLPTTGTVLIYGGGFELSTTKTLAQSFPEFHDAILSLHHRMTDLIRPFEERYIYTKEMKGSLSFKDILPALVPDCTYKNLEIANGQMVSNASEQLLYTTDYALRQQLLRHLSAYCKQDTYGMFKLVEKLRELIRSSKA